MSEEEPSHRQVIVMLAVTVEGGLILLAWILGYLLDQPPLHNFSWVLRDALLGVAATLPLLLFFGLVLRWPIGPLGRIKHFSEQVLCPLLAPCSILDLLGISILAGLGEEMLFRGTLQGAFTRWMPSLLALGLVSTLFGVLHAVTLGYAVMATLMGAYLGWLRNETGNLLVPVVAHSLYDFFVLLYLLRGPGSEERTALPLEEPVEEDEEVEEPASS
jgi:membrane protease YdiL (CAAX protease family)